MNKRLIASIFTLQKSLILDTDVNEGDKGGGRRKGGEKGRHYLVHGQRSCFQQVSGPEVTTSHLIQQLG